MAKAMVLRLRPVVTQLVTRRVAALDRTAAGIAAPNTSMPNTHSGGPWNPWISIKTKLMRQPVIWIPTTAAAMMDQKMKNRRRWFCRCSQRFIHTARSSHTPAWSDGFCRRKRDAGSTDSDAERLGNNLGEGVESTRVTSWRR
jgi:hypothetical protein